MMVAVITALSLSSYALAIFLGLSVGAQFDPKSNAPMIALLFLILGVVLQILGAWV